jgi:hypothetical protein
MTFLLFYIPVVIIVLFFCYAMGDPSVLRFVWPTRAKWAIFLVGEGEHGFYSEKQLSATYFARWLAQSTVSRLYTMYIPGLEFHHEVRRVDK